MNNDNRTTAIFVGLAAALMATAVVVGRPPAPMDSRTADIGTRFFPELRLPEQAVSLSVVEFDAATGTPLPFEVALVKGRWVIPSHSGYPADARDRLAKTAADIFDLTRESFRSDRPDDHKAMGVLDPLDEKAYSPEGMGRRIILRDKDNNALADLIVGKPVPGQPGQRFVRGPDQNQVYGVALSELDLSTRFADWIEPDLLKLDASKVETVVLDGHKIDVRRGTIDPGEMLTVMRRKPPIAPGESPWFMEGLRPEQEVSPEVLNTLTSTLATLRIVGVRPKPAGLSEWLKADAANRGSLNQQSADSLQSKGFYILDGRLVSVDGDVIATCSDGVVYFLRFGAVTFARGEALSAGRSGDGSEGESAEPAGQEGTRDSSVESRYLFVTASFDPSVIEKPKPRVRGGELPEDLFAMSAADRQQRVASEETAEAAREAAYQRALKEGETRAKELSDRFADWYYVVPGEAFRKVMLDRAALVRVKGSGPAAGGEGPFGGGGGLPPGLIPGRLPR